MRVVNSWAAFSVKVTTNKVSAVALFASISATTRSTKVNVLPDPGPAMISMGPSEAFIAFVWFLFDDGIEILNTLFEVEFLNLA